jgi:ubiquinone/menaquinone biosynthesis C-methylase UbiE
MQENASQPLSLDLIGELEYGVWKATLLKTALELDVFTVIAQGHRRLSDLVATTGYSERGLRALLDGLCPLGLLGKNGDEYSLTPVSDAFLVRGKLTYYGDFSLQTQLAWDVRARAAEAVRTGVGVTVNFGGPEAESLWATSRAAALLTWPNGARQAREMWDALGLSGASGPGPHVLDVACGSGVKSFALAQSDNRIRVTASDLPQVLEVAAQVARAMGVEDQVSYLPGDLQQVDLGSAQFDIILFGSILYYFNRQERAEILARAFQALKPGGLLVVNETIADEARCQAEPALMAAFQLFLFAPESEVFAFSEYEALLGQLECVQITQHNGQLISARRPL